MTNDTILVTGSEGFIGAYLVDALTRKGADVFPTGNRRQIDLLERSAIDRLPDADVVFHLAGNTNINRLWEDPAGMYHENINTTLNVLEYARKRHVRKLIFTSTYVYGRAEYLPVDEEHPVSATNPYTRSKIICEELCKAYSMDFDMQTVILRLFNVYGPGLAAHFLIPTVVGQVFTGTIELNDPRPKRDYVYVTDVVRALVSTLSFDGSGCDIFNIGSGMSYRVPDVVDAILRASGIECNVTFRHVARKDAIMDTVADYRKAKRLLNWSPEVSFETGIQEMVQQYQSQNGSFRASI
jgi:nucleoside-diphosphate-sugar epimerase